MWIKHIVMFFLGFCGGCGVAAGSFAFLVVIGIVPRVIYWAKSENHILLLENCMIWGLLVGTLLSLGNPWEVMGVKFYMNPVQETYIGDFCYCLCGMLHSFLRILFGFCAGIFVGCIAASLAEIMNTFPILFRRLKMKEGLPLVILSMALGKMVGSFFYFFHYYWKG